MTSALLVLLLMFAAVPSPVQAAGTDPRVSSVANVRPMRGWIAEMMGSARRLSPTLDRQLRHVASLPLIVYVDELSDPSAAYDGRLSFIGAGHAYRFLRIELRRLPRATTAAVLAHELQHVLEVAASTATSRTEFEALYRTIGSVMPGSGGARYDTAAAVATGHAAGQELAIYARTSRGQ